MRIDDNLVYLDYLRELFHYLVLAQTKKINKERKEDLGQPAKLFEQHKEAIMTQIRYASSQKNKLDSTKILTKYLKLSEYHNSTIDRFRRVINDLTADNSIVRDFFNDRLKFDKAEISGIKYEPKYSAEEHPEQADMLNILAIAVSSVLTPLLEVEQQYQISDVDVIDTISRNIPQQLTTLDIRLEDAIIDVASLL
jgi:hypothetical protein